MTKKDSGKKAIADSSVILLFADDLHNAKLKEQAKLLQAADLKLPVYLVLSDSVHDLSGNSYPDLIAAKIRDDFDVPPVEFLLLILDEEGRMRCKEAFVMDPVEINKCLNKHAKS